MTGKTQVVVPLLILSLTGGSAIAQDAGTLTCQPTATGEQLLGRVSPYDSTLVRVGGDSARICYSRPFAKEREIMGGLVPLGHLWRTGANEPTIIHLPFRAEIAGLTLAPGHYSLYTIPTAEDWILVINASTSQWGRTVTEGRFRNAYTEEVRRQEVGRSLVPSEKLENHVEQFTIRAQETGPESAEIILEWEETRVRIPVRRLSSED